MTITDYPEFDDRCHCYVIATAAGDAWEAYPPIAKAIANDISTAEFEGAVEEWVDSLRVYDRKREDEVAQCNIKSGEWTTISQPGGIRAARGT